ncbi:hypothetical protein PCI56_05635 [Plesiomonas shigelloides subsp. oncorhynchi]|nr:hypothetical protein [Plesiomonas shigelloides]
MLDLVDELEENNLTQMLTTLHSSSSSAVNWFWKLTLFLRREVFPVATLRRKGIELLTNILEAQVVSIF